jgi:YggT family protein
MGGNYITNPIEFLVNTLFGIYILAVMLRFLLAVVRADFYNPISQFLVKVTDPPLLLLRRILPSIGKLDTSSLVLMLALQLASIALIALLRGSSLPIGALLVFSCAELIGLFLNVLLFSIIVQVIISWINPGTYNPAVSLLYSLTEPLLGRCRRLIPPMSGLDLSPIVALIGIQLIKMLLLPPLYALAS